MLVSVSQTCCCSPGLLLLTRPRTVTATATYNEDPTHAASTATLAVNVVANPDFGQKAWGWLIAFAHRLHLFGL